jgi:hypothetical protein
MTPTAPFPFNPDAPLGLIADETDDYYHSTGFLGSSGLKCYHQSAWHFRKRYVDLHPLYQFKRSASVEAGSRFDLVVQAQGNLGAHFIACPDEYLTQKGISTKPAAKEWIKENAKGRLVIRPNEWDRLSECYDRMMANPRARELVEGADLQTTMRFVDPATGLPMQTRPDVRSPGSYLADVKHTGVNLRKYVWQARDMLYRIQAGLYVEADVAFGDHTNRVPFFLIVTLNTQPFTCQVFEFTESEIRRGRDEALAAMAGIAAREFTDQPQTEPIQIGD